MFGLVASIWKRITGAPVAPPGGAEPQEAAITNAVGVEADDHRKAFEEYLQEVLERLYDGEAEKNESIWRSTPFFVTAFGLVIAAISFLSSKAPPPAMTVWPILIYLMLIIISALAAVAFWWLFEMLRERTYGYLLNGQALKDHALGLKSFHEESGKPEGEAAVLALSELRPYVIGQLAETASVSRASNRKRTRARSLAVFFLMLATALAFLASALIFIADKAQAIAS